MTCVILVEKYYLQQRSQDVIYCTICPYLGFREKKKLLCCTYMIFIKNNTYLTFLFMGEPFISLTIFANVYFGL